VIPNGGELLLLVVLALIILGPDKLPEYAAKLAQFVRSARDMAEGAKSQIKEEMGPGFEDVDWKALDPRQYDPRRIVREALATPAAGGAAAAGAAVFDIEGNFLGIAQVAESGQVTVISVAKIKKAAGL